MEQWQIWTLVAVGAVVIGVAVWLLFFNKKDDDDDDNTNDNTPFTGTPPSGAPTGSPPFTGDVLLNFMSRDTKDNCIGAFGLRYLVPGYTGPVVRVQSSASTTDTSKDFMPTVDGDLVADGQTLESYIGGGFGRVVTWYDQSMDSYNKRPFNKHADSLIGGQLPEIKKNKTIDLDGKEVTKGWVITLRPGQNLKAAVSFPKGFDLLSLYVQARRREGGQNGPVVKVGDGMQVYVDSGKWAARYNEQTFNGTVTASTGDTARMDRILLEARDWPPNQPTTNVKLFINGTQALEVQKDTAVATGQPTTVIGGGGNVTSDVSEVIFFKDYLQQSDRGILMTK